MLMRRQQKRREVSSTGNGEECCGRRPAEKSRRASKKDFVATTYAADSHRTETSKFMMRGQNTHLRGHGHYQEGLQLLALGVE